eukprot:2303860-Amphidinium_carterae.2
MVAGHLPTCSRSETSVSIHPSSSRRRRRRRAVRSRLRARLLWPVWWFRRARLRWTAVVDPTSAQCRSRGGRPLAAAVRTSLFEHRRKGALC